MAVGIEIRAEQPEDVEATRVVNDRAFGRGEESSLIDALRASGDELPSLVAIADGQVVGHVLFSPATIERPDGSHVAGMSLSTMAVLPERQRQGIGEALVQAGLAGIRQTSCPFVIVLGHPAYYPRFGFEPAVRRGVRCKWDAPDAFMLLVLDEPAMSGVSGLAHYHPAFDAFE